MSAMIGAFLLGIFTAITPGTPWYSGPLLFIGVALTSIGFRR